MKVFQSGPDALKNLTDTVRKNTMLINAFEVSADDFYTDDDLFFNLTSDELQRLHRLQVFSDQYMAFYLKYAFSEELPENGLLCDLRACSQFMSIDQLVERYKDKRWFQRAMQHSKRKHKC